jgi:hypothetical protein
MVEASFEARNRAAWVLFFRHSQGVGRVGSALKEARQVKSFLGFRRGIEGLYPRKVAAGPFRMKKDTFRHRPGPPLGVFIPERSSLAAFRIENRLNRKVNFG